MVTLTYETSTEMVRITFFIAMPAGMTVLKVDENHKSLDHEVHKSMKVPHV